MFSNLNVSQSKTVNRTQLHNKESEEYMKQNIKDGEVEDINEENLGESDLYSTMV